MEALLVLIIWLAVLGVIVWGVTTYVPMPAPFKGAIYIVGALIALLLLLRGIPKVAFPC